MIRNKKIFHFANNDYDGAGIQVLNNHKYLIKNNNNVLKSLRFNIG